MERGINGKVIVKKEPFAGNSEKLTYADGTVGYRYAGGNKEGAEPRTAEPVSGARVWDDSMDGTPASEDEMEAMMSSLRQNGFPVAGEEPKVTWPQEDYKELYKNNARYRAYSDAMDTIGDDDEMFEHVRQRFPEFITDLPDKKGI